MRKKFNELEIGTTFICCLGRFKKIRNGYSKYEGNAIGVIYPREVSIQGGTLCTIID